MSFTNGCRSRRSACCARAARRAMWFIATARRCGLRRVAAGAGQRPYFDMVTNYQITAESAARAVIRVDNATTARRVVVESYVPLPPK